jgi:hypothetical protein
MIPRSFWKEKRGLRQSLATWGFIDFIGKRWKKTPFLIGK